MMAMAVEKWVVSHFVIFSSTKPDVCLCACMFIPQFTMKQSGPKSAP